MVNARSEAKKFRIELTKVHTVQEALKNIKDFFENNKTDWILLDNFIKKQNENNFVKKSNVASHFAASLELAKVGFIKLRQHAPFAPIYVKNNIGNK